MKVIFDLIMSLIILLRLIGKLILVMYTGYKVLKGDKNDISTMYYGILFVATLL